MDTRSSHVPVVNASSGKREYRIKRYFIVYQSIWSVYMCIEFDGVPTMKGPLKGPYYGSVRKLSVTWRSSTQLKKSKSLMSKCTMFINYKNYVYTAVI